MKKNISAAVIKKNWKALLTIIVIGVCLYYFFGKNKNRESFSECGDSGTGNITTPMPENARNACDKISTRAQEIEAAAGGITKIIQNLPFVSLFNPNNYTAGDNTSNDMMRNIINLNMSKCEVEKIYNSCNNLAGVSQSNILSTEGCRLCDTFPCTISGNTQINETKLVQSCAVKIAIKILSQKTASIDAQALAKVFQKVEGLLSGNNNTNTEKCNNIAQDMSTKTYLETKNDCLNKISIDQSNAIVGACSIIGNLQKNISEGIQKCFLGTTSESNDSSQSNTRTRSQSEIDQENEALTMTALIASSVASIISSSAAVFLFFGMPALMASSDDSE